MRAYRKTPRRHRLTLLLLMVILISAIGMAHLAISEREFCETVASRIKDRLQIQQSQGEIVYVRVSEKYDEFLIAKSNLFPEHPFLTRAVQGSCSFSECEIPGTCFTMAVWESVSEGSILRVDHSGGLLEVSPVQFGEIYGVTML